MDDIKVLTKDLNKKKRTGVPETKNKNTQPGYRQGF